MPANPETGEVSFEVSGKTYRLQFTIDAICQLEDTLDKSVGGFLADLHRGRVGALRAGLWAGLREHHHDVTIRQAGDFLLAPALRSGGAAQLLIRAINLAFGEDEEAAPAGGDGQADRPQT